MLESGGERNEVDFGNAGQRGRAGAERDVRTVQLGGQGDRLAVRGPRPRHHGRETRGGPPAHPQTPGLSLFSRQSSKTRAHNEFLFLILSPTGH